MSQTAEQAAAPLRALAALGRPVLALLASIGQITLFAASAIGHLFRPPFYWREFGQALMQIGWYSLPVVGMTAIFTGGALALQIYAGGNRFGAEAVVPQIVAIGMARELGPDNVRVNCITPGLIQTDITAGKLSDEMKTSILAGIPLNRLGDAQDIARAALFLGSDLSSYSTGITLDVNGGMLIH